MGARKQAMTKKLEKRAGSLASDKQPRPHRTVMRDIPSVGRMVHYFDTRGDLTPEAAIIIEGSSQWNGEVMLFVFGSRGSNYRTAAKFSERPQEGSWSWPERVAQYPEQVPLTDDEIAELEASRDA